MQQDVWKRVDKMYLDRTFNGQDWFGLRMTALKRKYKTTQEVYDAIKVIDQFIDGRSVVCAPMTFPLSHVWPPT